MDSKDFIRSPTLPVEPAPAYTPLANSDTSYHLAPLLNGRVGDIELQTVDGKKFLVHKSILEAETVFFHIYYGFVPVWRLNGSAPAPYHTSAHSALPLQSLAAATASGIQHAGPLSSLRKIITSTLAPSSSPSSLTSSPSSHPSPPPAFKASPLLPPTPKENANANPAQPVTAPTPTTSPYTWLVPEPSTILTAFLSLIYPRGTFTARPTDLLENPDITGRVIRAALGYQSTKAITLARDTLSQPAWIERWPMEVYSMACFFKFGDLARLASGVAVRVPTDDWAVHRPVMGRQGLAKLQALHHARVQGLHEILEGGLDGDEHTSQCPGFGSVQGMWERKVEEVREELGAESELFELLEVDLREGYCGHCLLSLGRTIQRCLVEARQLPTSI